VWTDDTATAALGCGGLLAGAVLVMGVGPVSATGGVGPGTNIGQVYIGRTLEQARSAAKADWDARLGRCRTCPAAGLPATAQFTSVPGGFCMVQVGHCVHDSVSTPLPTTGTGGNVAFITFFAPVSAPLEIRTAYDRGSSATVLVEIGRFFDMSKAAVAFGNDVERTADQLTWWGPTRGWGVELSTTACLAGERAPCAARILVFVKR
jgi:hypothetical protein